MLKMNVYVMYFVLVLSLTRTITGKKIQCPENYFECDRGICISSQHVCDGIINCEDGSDEICKETENETEYVDDKSAAVAAAQYLIDHMNAVWEDFLPRTAIALSFLGPLCPLSETEKHSLVDKLNIQLLTLFDRGIKRLPLHTLALYINAFYATCEDPRHFYNADLVELLRVEVDKGKGTFSLPVALTLCLSKEVRFEELNLLIKMYDDRRNFRIGTKALTLIIMAACQRQGTADHFYEMRKRMQDFQQRFQNRKNMGAYSTALIFQAYNAWGLDTSALRRELLSLQSEDGSFQDILGTYASIPALMNSSLADLQCKTRVYLAKSTRRSGTAVQLFGTKKTVDYTMSIPYGQQSPGNYSLTISFEGRESFFEIMKRAENLNPIFRFTFDEVDNGIKITSLGGISDDAESGLAWTLYKKTTDQSTEIARKDFIESGDVDLVYPQDGDHYVFKLEYSKYNRLE